MVKKLPLVYAAIVLIVGCLASHQLALAQTATSTPAPTDLLNLERLLRHQICLTRNPVCR